jgi:hypothetical protein
MLYLWDVLKPPTSSELDVTFTLMLLLGANMSLFTPVLQYVLFASMLIECQRSRLMQVC